MLINRKKQFFNKNNFFDKIFKLDWILLFIILLICTIGFGALYSASDGNLSPWALNHFYRSLLGFFVLIIISQLNTNLILNNSYTLYIFCIVCLIYVNIFGSGAVKRWIDLKLFFFQPSELTKIAIILFLAKFFSDFPNKPNSLVHCFISFLIVIIPTYMVVNQPDLGTGFMLFLLGVTLIFLNGLSFKIIFSLLFLIVTAMPFIWQSLYDYQKLRILVFLNPKLDSLGTGYQIMQSKIAIGSGGILGKGFLLGSQSRLDFLPEKHTDFIFTLIAEEMGFFGSIFVLFLFFVLLMLLFKYFLEEDNFTKKFIIFGVSVLLFLYITLNIGMVSGLVPVVGAPLPFISHGGTSLLTAFIGIGLVQNIRINSKLEK